MSKIGTYVIEQEEKERITEQSQLEQDEGYQQFLDKQDEENEHDLAATDNNGAPF